MNRRAATRALWSFTDRVGVRGDWLVSPFFMVRVDGLDRQEMRSFDGLVDRPGDPEVDEVAVERLLTKVESADLFTVEWCGDETPVAVRTGDGWGYLFGVDGGFAAVDRKLFDPVDAVLPDDRECWAWASSSAGPLVLADESTTWALVMPLRLDSKIVASLKRAFGG